MLAKETSVNSKVVVGQLQKRKRQHSQHIAFWFLLPSLILLSVFTFYPIIRAIWQSLFLTDMRGQATMFVGLGNYWKIFQDPIFFKVLSNTFVFVIAASFGTIAIALLLANLANSKLRHLTAFRTIFSSTMGVSSSVASIFWIFLFNPSVGLVNQLLKFLGMPHANLLTSTTGAMFVVILSSVWLRLGFSFLILLGALQSVPQDYYDAANISGISKTRQLFKISLPMISPTLFFLSITEIIGSFKAFAQVDLITGGGPDNSTNLIAYKVYQDAFIHRNIGTASAEAIVLAILIGLVTLIQFRFTERKVYYQ